MKWFAIASALLTGAGGLLPVRAAESCKTEYATTPTKHVPSSTVTRTHDVNATHSVVKTTTTTITQTTTFTITSASTTTTVPTGSQFTPIVSASSLTTGSSKRRRDVVLPRNPHQDGLQAHHRFAALASSSYPHSVLCTKTVTHTHTDKVTSTFTIGVYTGRTTTITTHAATATAYAACGSDNIISKFNGHSLGKYEADHSLPLCYSGSTGPSGSDACFSAKTCCEAAQTSGYSGWQFTNNTGQQNYCYILAGGIEGSGGWEFFSGDSEGHVFFGNGAYDGGVFAGAPTS